jgi:hypothetical protein
MKLSIQTRAFIVMLLVFLAVELVMLRLTFGMINGPTVPAWEETMLILLFLAPFFSIPAAWFTWYRVKKQSGYDRILTQDEFEARKEEARQQAEANQKQKPRDEFDMLYQTETFRQAARKEADDTSRTRNA